MGLYWICGVCWLLIREILCNCVFDFWFVIVARDVFGLLT